MKLNAITVKRNSLCFTLEEPFTGTLLLKEWTPVVHGTPRLVTETSLAFDKGCACLERFEGSHDRAFGRFELEGAAGVCYTTDFAEEASENVYPYPQPDTIKTLVCDYAHGKPFGIKQSRFDVSLPCYVSLKKQPGTIPFDFEGRTYYFYEKEVQHLEHQMAGYEVNTLILLNAPRQFGDKGEKELLDVCIHPDFEWNSKRAFISAFNVKTEPGWQVYGAFVEFMAQRFTRSDAKYGRIGGVIIGNEINLQEMWGNAGEIPVRDYMEEYTEAMRIAWICGKKHYSDFRVYVTLANNWNVLHPNPLYLYHGKDVIDLLGELSARDGDFGWHVAHHPYPECADFWNDREATFDFFTPRITYKNMEVLEAYLAQPQLLHKGKPRRILFSEQGFNSGDGVLRPLREKQAAAGYVLEYMKARSMKTVDMMANHAFVDNPREFGLSLGIYRYDPNAADHLGEEKPIAASVRAMDTPMEPSAVAFAREVIGDVMFDWLLHPTVFCGEPDHTNDTEFGSNNDREEG